MSKAKYHFNPKTLSYERIKVSTWQKVKKVLLHVLSSFSLGVCFFFIFAFFISSPYEKRLREENKRLSSQYKLLDKRLDEVQGVLEDLQQRDDNIYRVILGGQPISSSVRKGDYVSSRYEYLDDLSNADLVKTATKRVDEVRRMTYTQSRSYDEVIELSKNNKERLEHIPAIQPVCNKDLKYMASGYGRRVDPVYHTLKFHAGMDFAAPTGTKIFATGDGKVTLAEWKQGYGKCVVISHGYGYETLYAHMNDFNVRAGQEVRRGDVIGFVGSTGKSTGSHLHYEVHVNGSPVNPQNYYYADLSPEEYDKMLQLTENNAKVFD